jgi:hypothetical protein
MNRTLLNIAFALAAFGVAGCKPSLEKPEPICAAMPVPIRTTEVRWVPIDPALTAAIPDPGPKLTPGITVGGCVQSATQRGAALGRANARLACIAAVQARPVQPAAPSNCGADIPGKPPPAAPVVAKSPPSG